MNANEALAAICTIMEENLLDSNVKGCPYPMFSGDSLTAAKLTAPNHVCSSLAPHSLHLLTGVFGVDGDSSLPACYQTSIAGCL
jgi:hypothetical protein